MKHWKWLRFAAPALLVVGLVFTGPIACAPPAEVVAANERLAGLEAKFEAATKATPVLANLALDARKLDRLGAEIIQMRVAGIVKAGEYIMIERDLTAADHALGSMYTGQESDRAQARATFDAAMSNITHWHGVWKQRIPS